MNLHDFKLVSLPHQAHVVCQKGIFLGERGQDDHLIVLYRVHDFYVEVYYRLADSEILKLISFHSEVLLQPYLESICLKNLLAPSPAAVAPCTTIVP